MKITFKFLTLFALLALLLLPTNTAYAQGPGPNDGRVIFGSNFTLESGKTFNGDLVVFGGNVTIEKDANLKGNLVVIGGRVESNGETKGDVVVVGGQVKLEESAVVGGDVVTIGGQLERAESAKINGEVVNNTAPNIQFPNGRIPPTVPGVPLPSVVNISFNPLLEFGRVLGASLLMAFLGVLVTLFFQDRLNRVSQAAVTQPLMSSSIGLLTIVVMIIAAFRFGKAIRQDWAPAVTTGLGTFVLIFVVASIQSMNHLLPFMACVTWILPILIGLLAIGAVVITRFGARPVQSPALTVYSPPTDSGQAPPAPQS